MSQEKLRVLIATPFGARQRGGIDRLVDLIVDSIESPPSRDVSAYRLVTRGTGHLSLAPFNFVQAAAKFYIAAHGSTYRKATLARFARYLSIPYVVHLHGSRFDKFWPSEGNGVRRALA